MISRRRFIGFLAAGLMLVSRSSKAQQNKVFRIGLLLPGPESPYQEAIIDSIRNVGYTEGKNLVVEYRAVAPEELPSAALDLVRLKVDLIYTIASSGVRAAVHATREIPIVAVDLETDPVASGYASSLARPGGNLSGFFLDLPEFSAKRLEILKEALPSISGVTVLWDATLDRTPLSRMQAAARALKLRLVVVDVQATSDLEKAFQAASRRKHQAVMVMQSPTLDGYMGQILRLGTTYRLPVSAVFGNFATDGALISFGPNGPNMLQRSATYVDRVLRGAKIGDLPIQRESKFDLIVNARTAKSLGLTIASSILFRADRVLR